MFEKLRDALKEEQAEHAREALKTPSDPTLFEYGRACGLYQGFERALQAIDRVVKEEDEREQSEPRFE